MLTLGPIAFLVPAILTALLALPIIWWLLRVTPPAPRRILFPAIRLLFGLRQPEETPERTPPWLLILRILLLALIILSLAHPVLNPVQPLLGQGPILLMVDDGWAAARSWADRQALLLNLVDQADRVGRPVLLLGTAQPASGEPLRASEPMRGREARGLVQAMQAKPWPVDRAAARAAIERLDLDRGTITVWLSDDLGDSDVGPMLNALPSLGGLTVYVDAPAQAARLLRSPVRDQNGLALDVERPRAAGVDGFWVRAHAADGGIIGRAELRFAGDGKHAEGRLDLPPELLNRIAALRIEGEASAGAVVLLDESWRRRPVGIVGRGPSEASHPLLDDMHYVQGALAPFSDVRRAGADQLVAVGMAVIVLIDNVPLSADDRALLAQWVDRGGLLLRFAGPRLAEGDDDLLPVRLRRGGRAMGGALTWAQPQRLQPFEAGSPFAGLVIPPDVTVARQVLPDPGPELAQRTFASLADGTPLVTGARRGNGWLVLVHTAANPDWSSLSISGLFLQMLKRLVELSQGVNSGGATDGQLQPVQLLDGYGRLGEPTGAARALPPGGLATAPIGPAHPPGYYGSETGRWSVNLASRIETLTPLAGLPGGLLPAPLQRVAETDMKPWFLLAATLLALADLLIALWLRGLLPQARRAAALMALILFSGAAEAQTAGGRGGGDQWALDATLIPRLAYVATGDSRIDATSREGLVGLTAMLLRRTAVEPKEPLRVDVEFDELAFFPLLYWPIVAAQPALSERARIRVAEFLKHGGMVLFDTRDQGSVPASFDANANIDTPERVRLRLLLRGLNVPPLSPVPADHVLTKAFYLMNEFPGRWTGGAVWVERAGSERNDGVSSVIIGSHDWAAAWAVDEGGRSRYPVVPGAETQREYAFRFGINLVMYALTGNYKADQVHVPTILQRLGE
ncbi:MAG: DUF4159 domain-containing protein [Alphaproteobacteria bacterium]|nr:DUF4159 domain-containing protein [Alphaproteobacteria bacterium]